MLKLFRGIWLLLILMCLLRPHVMSQDIHFSQFLWSPLNLNPALTGSFNGDMRLCLNHKSQWQSFANAYSTFSGSFDVNAQLPFYKKSDIGVGLLLNSDKAGDANFSTNQVKVFLNYMLPLNADTSLFVSLGGSVAYTYHGIDISLLRFGSQYTGGQFDPSIPHNELLVSESIRYIDYSAGTNLRYISNQKMMYHAGFSLQHINEPVKSFTGNSGIVLPRKYVYHAGLEWNANEDLWLDPFFLFKHQGPYIEATIGSIVRIEYNPLGLKYIFGGLAMRARDSGIVMIGANYQDVRVCLSYDVNLSKLSNISLGRGGVELSLIYIYQKPRPFEPAYYRKCPEFM